MYIQGSGLKITFPMEGSFKKKNSTIKKAENVLSLPKDSAEIGSTVQIRLDLLEKVRKNIKSGYYNSENVLEDLSQSFAKALDQTV